VESSFEMLSNVTCQIWLLIEMVELFKMVEIKFLLVSNIVNKDSAAYDNIRTMEGSATRGDRELESVNNYLL
jgi:hypothetical protein